MLVQWEKNVGGGQGENFNMKEEDEACEMKKPYMQSIEDEEQMEDPTINIILIFDLQMTNKFMSNNCKSEGFGMKKFENDMLRVSNESLDLLAQSTI